MNDLQSTKHQMMRQKKFMMVRIGGNQFAIPLNLVREVIGLEGLSPLPNMPNYFAGIINLRGKIISAVNLKICLFKGPTPVAHLDSKKNKRETVIITEIRGHSYGAIVDEIEEVISILESSIDHSADQLNSDVVSGIIKKSDESIAPILIFDKAMKIEDLLKEFERTAA